MSTAGRITTENSTLEQRIGKLSGDNRTVDERLKAARSNLRFQDRRIADLQAQLVSPETVLAATPGASAPIPADGGNR
jgi:hypothetical protein